MGLFIITRSGGLVTDNGLTSAVEWEDRGESQAGKPLLTVTVPRFGQGSETGGRDWLDDAGPAEGGKEARDVACYGDGMQLFLKKIEGKRTADQDDKF